MFLYVEETYTHIYKLKTHKNITYQIYIREFRFAICMDIQRTHQKVLFLYEHCSISKEGEKK